MKTATTMEKSEIHFICPKCIKGDMCRYKDGDAKHSTKKKAYKCKDCGFIKKF